MCSVRKKALVQVFSCEFCKISKNTSFTEHMWETASEEDLCQNHSSERGLKSIFSNRISVISDKKKV